ncbi:MAG: hypothetical protein Q9171_004941 [Xanthocarpia ochracea]
MPQQCHWQASFRYHHCISDRLTRKADSLCHQQRQFHLLDKEKDKPAKYNNTNSYAENPRDFGSVLFARATSEERTQAAVSVQNASFPGKLAHGNCVHAVYPDGFCVQHVAWKICLQRSSTQKRVAGA